MTEVFMIVLLASGVIFWMLGGTFWKGFRRFLWPVVAGVVLGLSHVVWWKAVLVTGALVAVNTLPYGDRSSWITRAFVFASLVLPSGILSLSSLVISVPLTLLILLGLMFLSRKVNWVTHKIWEAVAGLLQAASLILAILK